MDEMDVVVEEAKEGWQWGCREKYTVAALATLGGGLTLGTIAESPVLASFALAAGPVYYFGRWACESKLKNSQSIESSQ